MYKKTITQTILLLVLTTFTFAETVNVYIPPDVLTDYQTFVAGRSLQTIDDYSGPAARRDVIEVVLFQQALAIADGRWQVNFIEQSDYAAMLLGIEQGDAIASVTSLWRKDLSSRGDSLYITTAAIERGQFEAGFYTTADNLRAMSARTNQQIRELAGVSSEAWVIDWKTLTNFGANVVHSDSWADMVEQVLSSRSDYLLAPFQSTPDMSLVLQEGTLVPIPEVKIALLGTRHFAVSRAHPLGWEFNTALHRGLMALKQSGMVDKAYRDCGFINTAVEPWREVAMGEY